MRHVPTRTGAGAVRPAPRSTTLVRAIRRAGAVLALALIAGGGITVASAPSSEAAPPYDTTATIDSLRFQQQTVVSGQSTRLEGTWSIQNHPAGSAGFSIALPDGLRGQNDSFPLTVTGSSGTAAMGTCTVNATTLYCDFDRAYLDANPLNLRGSFNFWVTVTTEVTQQTRTTYRVGQHDVAITVTSPAAPCPTCTWPGQDSQKWGEYDYDTNQILWMISVPSPQGGMNEGDQVTVTDHLQGDTQRFRTNPDGSPAVVLAGTNEFDANGFPTNWRGVDPTGMNASAVFTPDGGLLMQFTARQGWVYQIHVPVDVTDGGAQGTYRNWATTQVNSSTVEEFGNSVVRQGGGATGIGENVGVFEIEKILLGDTTGLEGVVFTVRYTVTAPGGTPVEDSFTFVAGETWRSPEFPRDSLVELIEVLPTEPSNIAWSDPVFSQTSFTLPGGTLTSITLTNEATALVGEFQVAKDVTGAASAVALVPGSTEFTLDYTYPAGPGFDAGGGTVIVTADGTISRSDAVPVGAVVTIVERTPPEVSGVVWGEPVISPSTFTVGADGVVTVSVENPVAVPPHTPTASVPPQASTAPALPATGVEAPVGLLMLALLTLAAGATMVGRRSRTARR